MGVFFKLSTLICFFLLFLGFFANGQLSQGGSPILFNYINYDDSIEVFQIPHQNNSLLKASYISPENMSRKGEGLKFAHPLPLNMSIDNSGSWVLVDDSLAVWRLALSSKGAYSLSVLFDKFVLPPSGRLFVYNNDRSSVLGAFTSANNRADSLFSTSPISGDVIFLEYIQAVTESQKPILSLSQLNHDFLDIFKTLSLKISDDRFGLSGDCNVDVSDDQDYDSTPQVRSVCKIIIGGTELCSGTIIANTTADSSLYFISAGHCFNGVQDGPNTLFYYNYESPHGESSIKGCIDLQTLGATVVAHAVDMDFALLKLENEKPKVSFRPYLSGWNRSSAPPAPFFALHHPQGDVKKISRTLSPLVATTYVNTDPVFLDDFHWLVQTWNSATTEAGSSGCGLFDSGGALVGTLSGGSAYCGNSVDDYFVRFERLWDSDSDPKRKLQVWLDPSNLSSATTPYAGREFYTKEKTKRLSHISASDSAIFRTNSLPKYKTGMYLNSPYSKVAESFSNMSSKRIEGVYLSVSKRNSTSGRTVKISFYEGISSPENLLLEVSNITLSTLAEKADKFISIPNGGLNVSSNSVFVSLEIVSPIAGDTLSTYYSISEKSGDTRATNSCYLFSGSSWVPYSSVYPGENCSLWLDLVVSDQLNSSMPTGVDRKSSFDLYPNPAKGEFSIKSSDLNYIVEDVELVLIDGLTFKPNFISESLSSTKVVIPEGLHGVVLVKILYSKGFEVKRLLIN